MTLETLVVVAGLLICAGLLAVLTALAFTGRRPAGLDLSARAPRALTPRAARRPAHVPRWLELRHRDVG